MLLSSLISGGVAGVAVDTSLFPLDTLKTRLQTKEGFWKSGCFINIYAGLGPAAVGVFASGRRPPVNKHPSEG